MLIMARATSSTVDLNELPHPQASRRATSTSYSPRLNLLRLIASSHSWHGSQEYRFIQEGSAEILKLPILTLVQVPLVANVGYPPHSSLSISVILPQSFDTASVYLA